MKNRFVLFAISLLATFNTYSFNQVTPEFEVTHNNVDEAKKGYNYFLDFFISKSPYVLQSSLKQIALTWNKSYEILAIETIYFSQNTIAVHDLLQLLEEKTGKEFKLDFDKWYDYIWNKPAAYNEDYYKFKAEVHGLIDLKFYRYFDQRADESLIRLDEVRWGGVVQDGIPPLRNPKMIDASIADYLEDSNIVFGIEVNGEARAYPKRILAWHEMFTDVVGNTAVAGVYCTLCGTVILYKTNHKGQQYQLGTSGFLYRSNKMMYDKKTQSLWSTSLGKPVLGPLVNKNIELDYLSVVTTTWKEWKTKHPNTKVLSLKTGHKRNYGEGVAYNNYFSSDKLMFTVPKLDKKLLNKDEVLVIRSKKNKDKVLAVASSFLKANPIYDYKIDDSFFTVITDASGAHRVYYNSNIKFKEITSVNKITDINGYVWDIGENTLSSPLLNKKLLRLHSYNAFWFGINAAFKQVELIK